MQETIEADYQTFLSDSGSAFGAVRRIATDRRELVIYVENAGEFAVPFDAVEAVHAQKVILARDQLTPELRKAIDHAHDDESRYRP